jgi:transposase
MHCSENFSPNGRAFFKRKLHSSPIAIVTGDGASPEDPVKFREQVRYIYNLHAQAQELFKGKIHLVSTDEMTGIQALERAKATRPMKLKRVELLEIEYIRHGTQALIANWHIATGKVISPSIGATGTEEDFRNHIAKTIDTDPEAGWVFIVDQLNTHKSESLVRLVAQRCGVQTDLGAKEKYGILKSMESRASFLSDLERRIRLVYIPKHTSWLNQIECWLSILVRRLLKRGNFTSTSDLKQKLLDFIAYFNQTMGKPFNWKFDGFPDPD